MVIEEGKRQIVKYRHRWDGDIELVFEKQNEVGTVNWLVCLSIQTNGGLL